MSRTIAYIKADELIKTLGQKAEANAERGYMTAFDVIHECIEIVKAQPKLLGIVGCSTIESYNKGLEDGRNEVWELVKKLSEMPNLIAKEIFGYEFLYGIVINCTPQEALAKLEAYEKEQNEIKVGDVVQYKYKAKKILVTRITTNKEVVYGFDEEGYEYGYSVVDVKKTGKHIDISSILQQIGGDTSES